MAPEKDAIEDEWIVVLKQNEGTSKTSHDDISAIVQKLTGKNTSISVKQTYSTSISGFLAGMTMNEAKELAKSPEISYIEQNMMVSLPDSKIGKPNIDAENTSGSLNEIGSWGLDRIDQRDNGLDGQYEPFSQGEGVNAYIIDTGILTTHNDFDGRATWGTNTADNTDMDCNGHGTHVAGTVGGTTYGVAKKVDLIAVKVLACNGSGTLDGVIRGIEWIQNDANGKSKPATANMSLGGGYSMAINDAVRELHQSGVVTVAAAGNDSADACSFSPASERSIVTVGSTTTGDARSYFSNFGECVDIFAPGSSIKAPWIGSNIATNTISGTSMASPHVCGAAALYLSASYQEASIPNLLKEIATPDALTDVRPGSPNKLLFVNKELGPTASPTSSSPTGSNVPSSSPTTCAGHEVVVTVNTDRYPEETTWTLENTCGDSTFPIIRSGPFSQEMHEHVKKMCVPSGQYKFTVNDSMGDGICCQFGEGSYSVELDGEVVKSGAAFGSEDQATFGSCEPESSAPTVSSTSTPKPSTSPTSRPPTTDNDPSPFSWDIERKSSEVVTGEGNPRIQVDYKTSNRSYSAKVFQEDCITSLTSDLLPVSTSNSNSDEKGFIDIQVLMDVDQGAIEDDGAIWTPDASGAGGSFKFCLSTALYRGDGTEDENLVTRNDVLIEVSVSNVADFEAGGIAMAAQQIDTVELAIEYQGEIDAYQCDGEGVVNDQPIGPFDLLHVCIKVKEDESMAVNGVLDFTMRQGSLDFPAIHGGIIDDKDKDVVGQECGMGYCRVTLQPLAAFFLEPDVPVGVIGMATIGTASAGRSPQQKNFELKVSLVQDEPCKEGAGLKNVLRHIRGARK